MVKKNLAEYENIGIPPADSTDEEIIENTETELTNINEIPIFVEKKNDKTD